MTPEEMLKETTQYLKSIEEAKKSHVAVGLPQEEVGGKVYGNGMSIIRIGAMHEYGIGNNPMRSFLREPFNIKKSELDKVITSQFKRVAEEGEDVQKALGLIGAAARNISVGAFTTKGYGKWPDITQETKSKKGSSQVLIDTGTLRNSITWAVRSS